MPKFTADCKRASEKGAGRRGGGEEEKMTMKK
jgi:hypothetical protein